MSEDYLFFERQHICNHDQHKIYKERRFDILNGFELVYTRCINCHKVISLETKKFS